MKHYALDLLSEYGTEDFPGAQRVVNPEWRKGQAWKGSYLRNYLWHLLWAGGFEQQGTFEICHKSHKQRRRSIGGGYIRFNLRITAGVIYPKIPPDSGITELTEEGIKVVWHDESIEESKVRNH